MLISLAEAKAHLRIDWEDDDVDVQRKAEEASAIILDYLKVAPSGWDETSAPLPVKAATKVLLAGLWEDREGAGPGDYLAEGGAIARLLTRFRDPTAA